MPPRAAGTAAEAEWAGCTNNGHGRARVTWHVHVLVHEMFKRAAAYRSPFSFPLLPALSTYLGNTKLTVTGTQTRTGTPSLVAGR